MTNQLWSFFLQGFHFHTHPLQTVVTLLLSIGLVTKISQLLYDLAEHVRTRPTYVRITSEEWQNFKEIADAGVGLAESAGKLALAASDTATAAEASAAKANHDNDAVASSVNAVNSRLDAIRVDADHALTIANTATDALTAIGVRIQRLEAVPTPQVDAQGALIPSDFKTFQLEVSNTLDELREEIRLFKEDMDGRLTMIEFESNESKAEAAIVNGLAEIQPTIEEASIPVKRGRGRPLGSKNKKKSGMKR